MINEFYLFEYTIIDGKNKIKFQYLTKSPGFPQYEELLSHAVNRTILSDRDNIKIVHAQISKISDYVSFVNREFEPVKFIDSMNQISFFNKKGN